MTPILRTILTHIGTASGAAIATGLFLATKSVDMYAIIDQLNTVVADVSKLVALVVPLATAAYAVWKSTTKAKLEDVQDDDRVKGIVATPELADALGPKVQASVGDLLANVRMTPPQMVA